MRGLAEMAGGEAGSDEKERHWLLGSTLSRWQLKEGRAGEQGLGVRSGARHELAKRSAGKE